MIRQNGTDTICFTWTGSVIGPLNQEDTCAKMYSYDACLPKHKRKREHLDQSGLINIPSRHSLYEVGNGRMYDPVLGRFLGVDPIIQDAGNSQNLNGYGYCLNNPLKYTDPSGYSYTYRYYMRELQESQQSGTVFYNNYPSGWEDYVRYNSEAFQTTVRTAYAINILLNSSNYGGTWSNNTGMNYFGSYAEAFFDGAIYNDYFNSWGSSPEMASSFVNACSRYSEIRLSQSLTASNAGVGVDLENTTPWMEIAIREIGQTERITDPNDPSKQIINPRVQGYFTDGGFSGDPYTTPWCAIFANYCLQNAGIKGTGSASSQSFLSWGQEINRPVFGSIAVYAGHVGFVVRTIGNIIYLLGGNQSNMVSISHYATWSKENVKSYRYPSMYRPSPFVW